MHRSTCIHGLAVLLAVAGCGGDNGGNEPQVDSGLNPDEGAADLEVVPVDMSGGSPPAVGVYGMAIQGDGLANAQVGGTDSGASNVQVAYRFRAGQTSPLNSIRWYCIDETHPGYGGGNGGTLAITVQTDNGGGFPSGTILATRTVVGPPDSLQETTFPSPPALTAGTLYHIVFTNIDPLPTVNFVSTDSMYVGAATATHQPKYRNIDWGQTAKYGASPWESRDDFTPILQLNYANGSTEGMGYMESSIYADPDGGINGASHMVRESFTVSGGPRTVTAASVRLRRVSGTDPLTIRLESSAGALIEEVHVPSSAIPSTSNPGSDAEMTWVTGTFQAPHVLANGQSYNLRLSTASSTTYSLFTLRKGSDYGFSASTYFGDGSASRTTNGTTWTGLGRAPGQEDMQFYFTTAQ